MKDFHKDTMVSKKGIKYFFMLAFYTCSMILFVLFYMQDQMNDYIKRRTTLSTRFDMPDEMEFPTMTICIQEGMKESFKDKYGLSENVDFWLNNYGPLGPPNNTLSETFEDLSFILNRDFTIGISQFLTLKEENLTLGINFVHSPFSNGSFDSYSVESLKTVYYGTCYKIQPIDSGTWFNSHRVKIRVSLLIDNLRKKDRPKAFDIYFTSNKTWHGIVGNDWKRFRPTSKSMKFGKQSDISIRNSETIYKEGIENTTSCYTDVLMKTANCPFMCDLLHTKDLPECSTYEELKCMYENWNWINDCLRHKVVKRYSPTLRNSIASDYESILNITFESKESKIVEEIDIISFPCLIGSIGGSLGMFFGFSFSGYFHILFDKCFEKYFNY